LTAVPIAKQVVVDPQHEAFRNPYVFSCVPHAAVFCNRIALTSTILLCFLFAYLFSNTDNCDCSLKFVGPVYGPKEAHALAESPGWVVKPDGEYFRRVAPALAFERV